MNYYNDNDPFCCAWLAELIKEGLLPEGDIDDRSITEIEAKDLKGYGQCHFFAGIGGWPLALQLAEWGADRPVWTGSCPCQPLSCAGKQKGHEDERHLWPAFYSLIRECRPPTVFGEQVASKLGLEWIAGVRADLEAAGYAVGAADLCAAGVGAPHIRQRLWWVADSTDNRQQCGSIDKNKGSAGRVNFLPTMGASPPHRLADSSSGRVLRASGDSIQEKRANGVSSCQTGNNSPNREFFWQDSIFIPCADGKWRKVPGRVGNSDIEIEPALFPLADGIPNRVGILRGAGNAIVPQVAAEFIKAYMEV